MGGALCVARFKGWIFLGKRKDYSRNWWGMAGDWGWDFFGIGSLRSEAELRS